MSKDLSGLAATFLNAYIAKHNKSEITIAGGDAIMTPYKQ